MNYNNAENLSLAKFFNYGLEVFYIFIGVIMLYIAYVGYKSIEGRKKYTTALFWTIFSITFILPAFSTFFKLSIPGQLYGILLVISSLLTVSKNVKMPIFNVMDDASSLKHSKRIKSTIFIPSLFLALTAITIAMLFSKVSDSSLFAIGAGAIVALLSALLITKAKPIEALESGSRLLAQMGPTATLPQVLSTIGVLFSLSGVGLVISNIILEVVPSGNILIGVIAYVLGMVIFTMIMGNAFAAFTIITLGIGIPFVYSQGANPAIAGALAITAGYCGTLLTPMAANFNIMPVALLEIKNQMAIIKYQAPIAISLIIIHILAMFFLAF